MPPQLPPRRTDPNDDPAAVLVRLLDAERIGRQTLLVSEAGPQLATLLLDLTRQREHHILLCENVLAEPLMPTAVRAQMADFIETDRQILRCLRTAAFLLRRIVRSHPDAPWTALAVCPDDVASIIDAERQEQVIATLAGGD